MTNMNAMELATAELITSVLESLDEAKDFVLSELPDVIQQLLMWKMAEGSILVLIGLALSFIAYQILKPSHWVLGDYLNKCRYSSSLDMNVKGFICLIAGGLSSMVGPLMVAHNLMTPLQIWIAPKVYLIEYASALIK